MTDPLTNSLKAFGYAQYGNPAEVLTTMRILNGLDIQGQALLVSGALLEDCLCVLTGSS